MDGEHLDDPFVKKAQKEGYRARAAYKLLEIQEKYKADQARHDSGGLGSSSWELVTNR